MAVLASLILLVVGVSGALAERGLRAREERKIERSLRERAELVSELTRSETFSPDNLAALDALADRAASVAHARVTLIGPDGGVLGDSDVSAERIPDVENHADRPEVIGALVSGFGTSSRVSETVGRPLLYLAVPGGGSGRGVVRLAVDLSGVDAAVSELRWELFAAGLIGLAAAVAVSYGLAWYTLRPIREVRRGVASLAGGALGLRRQAPLALPLHAETRKRAADRIRKHAPGLRRLARRRF